MNVLLTKHAAARARDRFALTPRAARTELEAALEAGRRAKTKPRWLLVDPNSRRHTRQGLRHPNRSQRYVWPADESRAWVVVRTSDGWVAITCYGRRAA